MSPERRFLASVAEAWHSYPSEMGDPGVARLRDLLTIGLEDRGMVSDGLLTPSARQLIAELRHTRTKLVAALRRAGEAQ